MPPRIRRPGRGFTSPRRGEVDRRRRSGEGVRVCRENRNPFTPLPCGEREQTESTAGLYSLLIPLDRRVHLNVAAAFLRLLRAEREVVARDRHARLPFQMIGPIA